MICKDFEKAFYGLIFDRIENADIKEIEGYDLFQLQIGDKLLCFEVADSDHKGGRVFIMDKESVDGAGVFPL